MRSFVKGTVGAVIALSLCVVVSPAHAASLSQQQINAVLGLLQAFGANQSVILNVQATLTGSATTTWQGSASSTNWGQPGQPGQNGAPGQIGKAMCITLNQNLSLGARGSDVTQLQQVLSEDPEDGFNVAPTGYFGPLTEHALARFQAMNGIVATSSLGGFVGPITRDFFERHCGEGLGNSQGQNPGQGDMGTSTEGEQGGHPPIGGEGFQSGGNAPMIAVVFGTVASSSASSLTITDVMGGGTRVVNITASTTIAIAMGTSTPTTGTVADLTVGTFVTVHGHMNPDNSITATTINVGPIPALLNRNHEGGDN